MCCRPTRRRHHRDRKIRADPGARDDEEKQNQAKKKQNKQLKKQQKNQTANEKPKPASKTNRNQNQINAQKSTGPCAEEGKTTSSRNAWRHEMRSECVVLPTEDPAHFEALRESLRQSHRPVVHDEEALVDRISVAEWKRGRYEAIEADIVSRYRATMDREYHRSVTQLRQTQRRREQLAREAAEAEAIVRVQAGTAAGMSVKDLASVLLVARRDTILQALRRDPIAPRISGAEMVELASFGRPNDWSSPLHVASFSLLDESAFSEVAA